MITTKSEAPQSFQPFATHDQVVAVDGLDDLFQWASEMVADGADTGSTRVSEQKIRRNVFDVVRKNQQYEAQEKYQQEIGLLNKRVIALLQIVNEKMEQTSSLQQIVTLQYLAMLRIPDLESEVKQLQSMTWFREEAEAERKHLLNTLSKLKKERDFLDDLVVSNETENTRLSNMLKHTRAELIALQNRRWWHAFLPWFKNPNQTVIS